MHRTMTKKPAGRGLARLLLLAAALSLVACNGDRDADRASSKPVHLEVWFHSGQPDERATIERQVARFNAGQNEIDVRLTLLPEGAYNAQVQAAALAGELPDVLDFDGPFLYNYVWQGHLLPLDDRLAPSIKNDLLPSIILQGTYRNRLYAIGTFDSGLGLWGSRRKLQAAGARIPRHPDEAWTIDEFDALLAALANQDRDGAVLDLKLNYPQEWFTYAFSPIVQSAGGDLIDRRNYRSAEGVLNGAAAVAAMRRLQGWFEKGYVDPNLDDAAFVGGRVALSWAGHWEYRRYAKALGDDLVLLPLPDFGRGSKTGQGSWAWGITARGKNPAAAMTFIEFLLGPDEVLAMADANGAVPATRSAVARSSLYGEHGPLRLFVTQLDTSAVPRPRTPAYPVISSAFRQAFEDIRNGGNVKRALDKAVTTIDQDIIDNKGYPAR